MYRSVRAGFQQSIVAKLSAISLCLAATSIWASAPAPKPVRTVDASQVADRIDSIIQPRFQVSAGQFGQDRVVGSIDGHPRTFEVIDQETNSERSQFASVIASKRPFVMGLLHCSHRLGSHLHTHDGLQNGEGDDPQVIMLVSAGISDLNAQNNFDWCDDHLSGAVKPDIAAIKRGQACTTTCGQWLVVMRPIKAEHEICLSCHLGAKRGDTLGAMVYAIRESPESRTPNHYFYGEAFL